MADYVVYVSLLKTFCNSTSTPNNEEKKTGAYDARLTPEYYFIHTYTRFWIRHVIIFNR